MKKKEKNGKTMQSAEAWNMASPAQKICAKILSPQKVFEDFLWGW